MPKRLRGREYPLMSVAALPPWRLETVLKKAGARQKKSWKVASPQTSQTTRVDSGDAADDSSASTDVTTEESGVTSGMSSDRQKEVTAMVGNLFMKSRGE
uniref:Uncharacterized protein n=2 Tax=Octactis speculum TaxID=3111310 RepID=A0A7S2F924_9STRA|mmetsp:Transcript_16517/g.22155  ORF Transcript_16517/g.22155 Transcript_16517/m.22155 type:complete len:100 (+) Transcript_16517:138-437(+)